MNGQEIDKITVVRTEVIDTSCDWVSAIYISTEDVLTLGTATQILTLNESWKVICKDRINSK